MKQLGVLPAACALLRHCCQTTMQHLRIVLFIDDRVIDCALLQRRAVENAVGCWSVLYLNFVYVRCNSLQQ